MAAYYRNSSSFKSVSQILSCEPNISEGSPAYLIIQHEFGDKAAVLLFVGDVFDELGVESETGS